MNKEKEIEEMAEAIDKRLDEANEWIGSMNKGKGNWIAEGLFPTYRKADEARKETAREILEYLRAVQEKDELKNCDLDWIAMQYGVEVDE